MTRGNLELLEVIVSWAVTLPSVAAIIVRDERRLRGEMLARAWPPVTRDASIFGLWNLGVHPLCLLVHFGRTRRSLAGVGLGLLWLLAVVAADWTAENGMEALVAWAGI
ncbi:MAG TPA: hypothetical protein VE987_17020 [Polyangiaceae bacterium]|nr:hypothetical protein [Polyangiaceae bacterium]